MNFRFRSHEKLKDAISVSYVFENGNKFHYYPILFLSAPLPFYDKSGSTNPTKVRTERLVKMAFSVPKRRFRKAVHRNRIKRMMREAYRLQKHHIQTTAEDHPPTTLGVVAIYIGKEIPEYSIIFKAMNRFIDTLTSRQ